jgi:four helix bundle protein
MNNQALEQPNNRMTNNRTIEHLNDEFFFKMEIKKRFDNTPILVRFKKWCYSCLDIVKSLEYNNENKVIINQVVRSATSSYMNYRTVNRAKSKADMINKLKIVEEETDETIGWLEMIQDRNNTDTSYVCKEADELLRIVVSSIATLRRNT